MLSWASSQFEKIAQTVAPPPTDAVSRFVYCCQRGEENEAMQLASQLPGSGVIVNQSKQQVPLHVACSYGMMQLTRYLLNQPGASLDMLDGSGNTMLHCAAMCAQPAGLELVKMLVSEMGANVCAKNYQGQTPYDVATLNNIRQYLLPIQLQQETKEALANGGQGLPPGIDMGTLKIQNAPPPPIPGGGGSGPAPPQVGPPPVGPPPQGMTGPSSQGMPASPYPEPPNPFGQSISAPPSQGASPYPQPPYPASAPTSQGTTPYPQSPYPGSTPTSQGASPYPQPPYSGSTPTSQGPTSYQTPAQTAYPPNPPAAPTPIQSTTTASTAKSTTSPPLEPASSSRGKHEYALTGYSSAAIYKSAPGSGGIRPDGFHSSSSDKRLQQKYGHAQSQYANIPPPPSSGSSLGGLSGANGSYRNSASAPPSGGPNPYAGGLAHRQRPNRYVNYNPVTGQAPTPAVPRPYSSYGAPMVSAAPGSGQYNVFQPGATQPVPAPASAGMPAPMPPPPFQHQQPQQQQPAKQEAPSSYAPPPGSTPSYPTSPHQAPQAQTSPFVQAPVASPAPAASAMFASPAVTSPSPAVSATSTGESASALFSNPAGEASAALSGPAPTPKKPVTTPANQAPAPSPALASPLPPPPMSTEKAQQTTPSPFASNAAQASPAAMFASPPKMKVDAAASTFATPPSAPVAAVPEQVSFSNREVSGVSVMSSASDIFSKPSGTAASDAFASPPAAVETSPAKSPDVPPAPRVDGTKTPDQELVEIVEEEDFDKMDDVPLSPQATPNQLDSGTGGQPTNPSVMPPPPFSST